MTVASEVDPNDRITHHFSDCRRGGYRGMGSFQHHKSRQEGDRNATAEGSSAERGGGGGGRDPAEAYISGGAYRGNVDSTSEIGIRLTWVDQNPLHDAVVERFHLDDTPLPLINNHSVTYRPSLITKWDDSHECRNLALGKCRSRKSAREIG